MGVFNAYQEPAAQPTVEETKEVSTVENKVDEQPKATDEVNG